MVEQSGRETGRGTGQQTGGTKAQRTRARILAAAAEELAERDGLLEITGVATRCACSPGLIYRYFSSRVDLLAAVVEEFYDRYDHWVMDHNPLPGGHWAARERERMQRGIHFIHHDSLAPVVLLNRQKEPEVSEVEVRRLKAHLELSISNVQQAQTKGEIPRYINPQVACPMVMGGVREVFVQSLEHRYGQNKQALLDEIMLFICRAMDIDPAFSEEK